MHGNLTNVAVFTKLSHSEKLLKWSLDGICLPFKIHTVMRFFMLSEGIPETIKIRQGRIYGERGFGFKPLHYGLDKAKIKYTIFF